MQRRHFLKLAAATAVASSAGAEEKKYVRANTDWLAACRYGVGLHWSPKTTPRNGPPVPFHEAVDNFDVHRVVDAVVHAGADYLLFTAAHALQMVPAPNPVIDGIAPDRTCQRDLLKELADACAGKGLHFLLYYNHSCNSKNDFIWEKAVGYHDRQKDRLVENLCNIVGWMSRHYGERIKAWWFDSPFSLDDRGPFNQVTTDLGGFQFPWERFTEFAKQGHPERLVSYNSALNSDFLFTTHQDYWGGEMNNLNNPAKSRYLDNGLQWFGWTPMDNKQWDHVRVDTPLPDPRFRVEDMADFVRTCNAVKAPMTFNVGIYQDGTMAPKSLEHLRRMGEEL